MRIVIETSISTIATQSSLTACYLCLFSKALGSLEVELRVFFLLLRIGDRFLRGVYSLFGFLGFLFVLGLFSSFRFILFEGALSLGDLFAGFLQVLRLGRDVLVSRLDLFLTGIEQGRGQLGALLRHVEAVFQLTIALVRGDFGAVSAVP